MPILDKMISLGAILLFMGGIAVGAEVYGEAATPSQQMKQTFEGLSRLPQAIGKEIKDVAKKATSDAKAVTSNGTAADAENTTTEAQASRFSTMGKRDPFRALSLNGRASPRRHENLSPLERYELGQLKLVGVIWHQKDPRALVEDSSGLGYIVKMGTLVGVNDGKIKAIKPTEVVIEETYSDIHGARKRREINMKLLGGVD